MKPIELLIRVNLFLIVSFLHLKCSSPSTNNPNVEAVQNDLPSMFVMTANGTQLNIKDVTGKVVLILFQTDCDHCQREATAIQQNISAFKEYSLHFITTTSLQEIQTFANQYKLTGYPNVHFYKTSNQNILDNFGPIDAPSLYIYSDQKFVKAFNGETSINEILKYI
jgi:hypothetical protein